MFPELTAIHNEIEDSLDVNDDWLQIIDWSLFQAFHSESKNLLKNKEQTLFTHKVKMSEIQSRVIKNLNSEGWESLLAEYENDL